MLKEVALAHVETLLEWAQKWEQEAAGEAREGANEVAFLLRRAAQKIGFIHGTDISAGDSAIAPKAPPEEQGPLPDLTRAPREPDVLAEG